MKCEKVTQKETLERGRSKYKSIKGKMDQEKKEKSNESSQQCKSFSFSIHQCPLNFVIQFVLCIFDVEHFLHLKREANNSLCVFFFFFFYCIFHIFTLHSSLSVLFVCFVDFFSVDYTCKVTNSVYFFSVT